MSNQAEFFRTQARAMETQAAASALNNVRERCLRSAEAWTHMAERAERHEQSRERTERMKAEAAAMPVAIAD